MDLTKDEIREITKSVFLQNKRLVSPDLIFIFGGTDPDLWNYAEEKYYEFNCPDILVTGGNKPTNQDKHPNWNYENVSESEIISSYLEKSGIERTKILKEKRSTNSLENVRNSVEEFDLKDYKEILLITRSHGSGRQVRTFKSNFPYRVRLGLFSFDGVTNWKDEELKLSSTNWYAHKKTKEKIIKEYEKLLIYSSKGDFIFERKPILRIERKLREEEKIK